MEKVSIIIPLYNSVAFIGQCLKSACSQSYSDLEIIVVNDGSTDRSVEICKKLAVADDRIYVYNQKNRGVSAARNQGMDLATGTYLFFLDSDDVIHPQLIAEAVRQAQKFRADLVACGIVQVNNRRMGKKLRPTSSGKKCPLWQVSKRGEAIEWFHMEYSDSLRLIGGKLLRREALGNIRFDETRGSGEDTLFMYQLMEKDLRVACTKTKWYYYRKHPASATHSYLVRSHPRYCECSRIIRDKEYLKEKRFFALLWEYVLVAQMEQQYLAVRKLKGAGACRALWQEAMEERKHPLFSGMNVFGKLQFYACYFFRPLYYFMQWTLPRVYGLAAALKGLWRPLQKKQNDYVGILTFHCADNYGALLQACGLKQALQELGIRAFIVRYEPFFMTGRHWRIPYVPEGTLWKRIVTAFFCGRMRLRMGGDFSARRKNMQTFRKEQLPVWGKRRLLFAWQLGWLPFRRYIVGSDQIWNPAITIGLRPVYFGAFSNPHKEKVIAYGASLGGERLSEEYSGDFSKLINNVDAVSLREERARSYVRRFYPRKIEVVLDPVFLPKKEYWREMASLPASRGYILVYQTEYNREMIAYVKNLAHATGLPVWELQSGMGESTEGFERDRTAGPGEFLGYVSQAAYVVTNSFHGVAFSVIFEKLFLAFDHSSYGTRVKHILQIAGLEDRLYRKEQEIQITASINWEEVNGRIREQVFFSQGFLKKNLRQAE